MTTTSKPAAASMTFVGRRTGPEESRTIVRQSRYRRSLTPGGASVAGIPERKGQGECSPVLRVEPRYAAWGREVTAEGTEAKAARDRPVVSIRSAAGLADQSDPRPSSRGPLEGSSKALNGTPRYTYGSSSSSISGWKMPTSHARSNPSLASLL